MGQGTGEESGGAEARRVRAALWRAAWAVLLVLLADVLIELALEGADLGLWGTPLWRGIAYHYGAFWTGLLDNWRPNYAAQPAAMFLTYSFLHGGLWHLAGNMMMLAVLGVALSLRMGQWVVLGLYFGSAAFGASVFAMLNHSAQPMVGASGALFGLAGAWEMLAWRDLRAAGKGTGPVWRDIGLLAGMNVVWWAITAGQLAWETHLGGFVAGVVLAWMWTRATGGTGAE